MIEIYTYKGCTTCRKAIQWLSERQIPYQERPIRETPPSPEDIHRMLAYQKGAIKRLFNSSGKDYRAMELSRKLPELTNDEAVELLAANGNLIKRPFVLAREFGIIGFKANEWVKLNWPQA